jgi:hypothetical protein
LLCESLFLDLIANYDSIHSPSKREKWVLIVYKCYDHVASIGSTLLDLDLQMKIVEFIHTAQSLPPTNMNILGSCPSSMHKSQVLQTMAYHAMRKSRRGKEAILAEQVIDDAYQEMETKFGPADSDAFEECVDMERLMAVEMVSKKNDSMEAKCENRNWVDFD